MAKKRKPRYRSKFEGRVATRLSKEWEYEPCGAKYLYRLELNYKPDWQHCQTGVILEAKGVFDYTERRKFLALRVQRPDLDIRLVFMRNNRISKKSKMTYTEWCKKWGIPCSVYPELPI